MYVPIIIYIYWLRRFFFYILIYTFEVKNVTKITILYNIKHYNMINFECVSYHIAARIFELIIFGTTGKII